MLRETLSSTRFFFTEDGKTVMFRLVKRYTDYYVDWAGYETDERGNFVRTVVFTCYHRDSLEEMYDSYLSKKNLHGSMDYEWEEAENTWNDFADGE